MRSGRHPHHARYYLPAQCGTGRLPRGLYQSGGQQALVLRVPIEKPPVSFKIRNLFSGAPQNTSFSPQTRLSCSATDSPQQDLKNFENKENSKMAFCRSCGAQLGEGAAFCPKCGTAQAATTEAAVAPVANPAATPAVGMTNNVAGALAYLLGLITGILFLVLEPHNKDKFVR